MMQQVVIRADGGSSIGMGHIIRCLALAEILKNDFIVSFAIQSPTEIVQQTIRNTIDDIIHLPITNNFDVDAENFTRYLTGDEIVVLDGYNFKTNYQKKIKQQGTKLVAIDDLCEWHQVADVVINHAAGVNATEYSAEEYTRFYLGFDYVLLRKAFLSINKKSKSTTAPLKSFFISMGAADVDSNTLKFASALLKLKFVKKIHLMVSSVNPHLSEIERLKEHASNQIILHYNISSEQIINIIKICDAVICPASTISIEASAIGALLFSGYTADNQKKILNGLVKANSIVNFGNMNEISIEEINQIICNVSSNFEQINTLLLNQAEMIDGKSPERILTIFKALN